MLINLDNPFSDLPESVYYGDINTGTWFKEVKLHECSLPNHLSISFCSIDGLNVDKYDKLNVETVLVCCLYLNR